MLRGYVDIVSPQRIAGWAVDDSRLESPVEVSVFVNGSKIATVSAHHERPDLRQTGKHGDGKHGFIVQPADHLSLASDRRITVRFAESGEVLVNGDHVLSATGARAVPRSRRDLEERMRIPAPRNPRELFDIFALYDTRYELYDLIRRIDFIGMRSRDIQYCAFGRYPPSLQPSPDQSCRDLLNNALLSDQFQENVIPLLLAAYPEKRRLLFVHIPKCAGSDLSHHLVALYPSIEERVSNVAWTSKDCFYEYLHDFVRLVRFSNCIYVHGHINLKYYADLQLGRPGDEIFTILRDPREIPISQVNYIITRFRKDSERKQLAPDTEAWLRLLDLPALPETYSPDVIEQLARKILHNPLIVIPNLQCHWLGGGSAKEVLERLAALGVEVSDTKHYNEWLSHKWRIEAHTRMNASQPFVSARSLTEEDMTYVLQHSEEDIKLYEAVCNYLAHSGAASARADLLL